MTPVEVSRDSHTHRNGITWGTHSRVTSSLEAKERGQGRMFWFRWKTLSASQVRFS